MPIMEQIVIQLIGALDYFIKSWTRYGFQSLWIVEAHHTLDVQFWNDFWTHFENGEGKFHNDVFCIFDNIEIVTKWNFGKIDSWNFLDKYGSTRIICFTISFEFVSREREWSN